ncbi:MAG: hypothetical protein U0R17_00930 [Acidimicrobiia bacterium]
MTGLWTPNGEVNPENNDSSASSTELDEVFKGMSDEEKQAALEQITQMREELLSTPAIDVIGNHIVGFYELASVHLSDAVSKEGEEREKRLAQASLCIDAMASVVNGLGNRLGQHGEALSAALAQMQLAYSQVKSGQVTE